VLEGMAATRFSTDSVSSSTLASRDGRFFPFLDGSVAATAACEDEEEATEYDMAMCGC
jgi:hypothetical protein